MTKQKTHCGYIGLIGRPNVGKSTLMNRILGEKVSITSHKPQTTRRQILGIKTENNIQSIYVDTPGMHRQVKHQLNRSMNRAANQALEMVNVIGWIVSATHWSGDDDWILTKLKSLKIPVILIVNKIDKLASKEELLPLLQTLSEKMDFAEIIPISAKTGSNVDELEKVFEKYLPETDFVFPPDQISDCSDRFLSSEIIREKLMRFLHQEIPYSLTVEVESYEEKNNVIHISAIVWVEKQNQKAIVIGKNGEQLKKVGTQARLTLEKVLGQKVFLKLWAKVKTNWSDDANALKQFGY